MNNRTLLLLLLLLAGCASHDTPEAPPVVVPEATWRWVDWDIIAASQSATQAAEGYAHNSMQQWMDLVHQRTESDFIPWYSGYWTQQWLGMKVAWYYVNAGGESDPTVERLSSYLQQEYQDRVLDPVAEKTSPEQIRQQTTSFYVGRLSKALAQIPGRYGLPQDQFDQRLQKIPAIELTTPGAPGLSLYQLLQAKSPDRLPAYAALLDKLQQAEVSAAADSPDVGVSALARRTSEKLETQLAARGAASTVSSVVGKVAGVILSVGATTYGVIAHQSEKPDIEAQLRTAMNQAFAEDWQQLLNNRQTGVMAGAYYLSGVIETDRQQAVAQPLKPEAPSTVIVLPGIPLPAGRTAQ